MGRLSSDLMVTQSDAESGAFGQLVDLWFQIRAPIVAPIVQLAVNLCLVMVVMMFLERVYMCVVIVLVKLVRARPEKRYKFEAIKDDAELANSAYPKVLVQIPMYNEREVCMAPMSICLGLNCVSRLQS